MSIAHVYEDLVFLNHNALLLQFTEESSRLLLRVNREAEQKTVIGGVLLLKQAAQEHGMQFADGGNYALAQDGDDSVRIEFFS